jgi:hypothetical protein
MDFLDPKKRRRRDILNIVGYGLIAIALVLTVRIMLYQASGFGLDKEGKVVQNSLVFAASTPSSAQIRINGVLNKAQTNTRLSLPGGSYNISYTRAGYTTWQNSFKLDGGQIERLDYAMLYPTNLVTTTLKKYDAAVGLTTQSPDRRWLLVEQPGSDSVFDLYDLKNPKLAATTLTLPEGLITSGTTNSWAFDEWSNDNQHVLLSHVHDGTTEFILVDRSDSAKSVNLNNLLGTNPSKISLVDKKYDHYYVYDATAQTLQTASMDAPTLKSYLSNVLQYESYGSNVMLYASSKTTTPGKVGIVLLMGGKSYFLREVSGNTTYLLNLTQYSGDWYVALGAQSESKVYIYKNPDTQLNSNLGLLVPISVLKTSAPTRLEFSSNARFIMDENGSQFSVFDAEVVKTYNYDTQHALDAPQKYASWIDGNRLTYISGGKQVVFDFDHANMQTLKTADAAHESYFAPNYKYVYNVAPGSQTITSTALLTATDL